MVNGRASRLVSADSPVEASLWPNVLELRLSPGESVERTLKVHYHTGPPSSLKIERYDYTTDTNGQRQLVPPDDPAARRALRPDEARWAGSTWVTAAASPVTVQPGEDREIRLLVSVPTDAEPGEHHAYLLVGLEPEATPGAISIAPQFGVHIYITVPGAEVRQVANTQLVADHSGRLPIGTPLGLAAAFENTGTVSLRTKGEVVIERWLGGEVGRLPMPDERVVPGQRARVVANWAGPPSWEILGRYRATFFFDDPTLGVAASEGMSFWTINWMSLGGLFVIVLGARLCPPVRIARASFRAAAAGTRAFRSGLRE
jgi:hypothetical protein